MTEYDAEVTESAPPMPLDDAPKKKNSPKSTLSSLTNGTIPQKGGAIPS
ncbi:hypothetical protein HUG15_02710 [Salicibibacter cibarius]|uniref:Uncharacterized protein n=1 Tax=Salicibibacter cibarius TaxID=2743000 RepID=A0A7T6Z0K0_9BACI|nr:hypothetical protein [Salicibibacter cibarius]QQK74617.1 hypothetical protein HUG15_02710 [Salicibibacter cibarius]